MLWHKAQKPVLQYTEAALQIAGLFCIKLFAIVTTSLVMCRLIDGNLWLHWLLYWLLLIWYSCIVYALIALLAAWPSRPITSIDQIPGWASGVALVVIVATCVPVSHYLSRSLHHLVYGQHDDAYAIVERINKHLHADPNRDVLLPTLVGTLADTLKLPYVVIDTWPNGYHPTHAESQVRAVYGTVPDNAEIVTIPLLYHSTDLGRVQVSSRRPHERLSADDLRLLHDLARQVSITLHAAQLTADLQASRAQLVTAREEERRRIRRDLHDGLGPTLAALRLQLSALRHTVRQDLDAAEHLIDELRHDVRAATAEIRRLVYDLRPPMLDEFGLVSALRNLELTSDSLTRSVEAPEPFPPLPAALEVALYRIAAEALHNSVRHSGASHCAICLVVDATSVTLTVTDDGYGLPATYLAGVGHHSMHERAAELGGSVAIFSVPTGGTRVAASFPFKEV